jgi:hemolysin activation/secretion protein
MGANCNRWHQPICRTRIFRCAAFILGLAVCSTIVAQEAEESVASEKLMHYPVSSLKIKYQSPKKELPSPEVLMQAVRVDLSPGSDGYVAPEAGRQVLTARLDQIGSGPVKQLGASGVRSVGQAIVKYFNDLGYVGIYVYPSSGQFDDQGNDLRPSESKTLELTIRVDVVLSVRSKAKGKRFEEKKSENHPAHRRIRDKSPVQPTPSGPQPLIQRNQLNDYAKRLSRHPGRRVDVTISGVEVNDQVGAEVEYLVFEEKPLRAFYQLSNTGTEQTGEWRQTFGVIHNQVSNHDDILSLNYSTVEFDDTHAISLSYERPLLDSDLWRWRIYSSYSEYDASEVGLGSQKLNGQTVTVGAQIIYNFLQVENLFLDVVGGVEWSKLETTNTLIGLAADVDVYIPHVELRMRQVGQTASTYGVVGLRFLVGADSDDLFRLGRVLPDEDWTLLHWNFGHSFFLEPLLNPQDWADPSTPESSTLANEIALSFRGQYAFDDRLYPQAQSVVGGFYTVRGYEEAVASGDTALIASAEYRYHYPRSLPVQRNPDETPLFGQPFRFAPQQVYGRADWDLIFRAFVDAGVTVNSDRIDIIEDDETLIGVGVGVELQVRQNISVRLDWAAAIEDLDNGQVESGDNRLHFSLVLSY